MEDFTISTECSLPSQGMIYSKKINPNLKLRSMTTEEEMKRLGHSDLPYKVLPEIIDSCLIDKPGMSVYDMCFADYQYLLYRLRVTTYGPKYKVSNICPYCGHITEQEVNLDELPIIQYSEDLNKYLNITLPKSKDEIEIRMQTPRLLDEVISKTNALKKKSPNMVGDPAFLFTLISLISKVNNTIYDPVKLEAYVRRLSAMDANYIMKSSKKINDGFGLDTKIECKCSNPDCQASFISNLPITGEFFGPEID